VMQRQLNAAVLSEPAKLNWNIGKKKKPRAKVNLLAVEAIKTLLAEEPPTVITETSTEVLKHTGKIRVPRGKLPPASGGGGRAEEAFTGITSDTSTEPAALTLNTIPDNVDSHSVASSASAASGFAPSRAASPAEGAW